MSQPNWVVLEAIPHSDYSIDLVFADGTQRVFNARSLLNESFYRALSNVALFLSAHVECGAVVLNDDLDIAPECLYDHATLASC